MVEVLRRVELGPCVLYCGDCMDVLPEIRGDFSAVVTDPPYGIGASEMPLGTGKREFFRGEWDRKRPDISPFLISDQLCVWGGNYFTDVLPVSNDWLVWHKKNDGLSFSECEMAWTNFGCSLRHKSHHWGGEEKQHPTQKPLRVMEWCVGFVDQAATILDPFMGSGTTGVACVKTGRKFIGIEKEPEYFEVACERIRKVLADESFAFFTGNKAEKFVPEGMW